MPATPIQQWINAPPHLGSPGEQFMLPYDFGVGAMLAHGTNSSPTRAPLWAETAYHLRMAYGESYVQQLARQAQDEDMTEEQLMRAIEARIDDVPAARSVPLFWTVGDSAAPGRSRQRRPASPSEPQENTL